MKVKALFLDFDGVITTEKSNFVFDPLLLARLGCILVVTGAKIVISSSRRGVGLKDTLESIVDPENTHVRNVPFPFVNEVIGITPHIVSWFRGQQVDAYLKEHPEISDYAILDDKDDFYPEQKKHLILVDGDSGLTDVDVQKAIALLSVT